MNSCLYKARVMHHRLSPRRHGFHYNVFLFYLDLEEIGELHENLRWLSHNRFNLFNFRDNDHLEFPATNDLLGFPTAGTPGESTTTGSGGHGLAANLRENLRAYLKSRQIELGNGRVMLLTNLRTLGYQFNPVSFYFCYDESGVPLCSVAEVSNTFHEMKPYLLGPETRTDHSFQSRQKKLFYVSPFIDMDSIFHFRLDIPGPTLRMRIDDYDQAGNRFFISTLTGTKKSLKDSRLLVYFFSLPLITLKVIMLIHWQALRLWIKKIPYHKKEANKHLQQEVYKPYKANG